MLVPIPDAPQASSADVPSRSAVMSVHVKGFDYTVSEWRPGMSVIRGQYLAVDTETELIIEGQVPKLVLIQVACHESRRVQWVWWEHADEYLDQLFARNKRTTWVMHNAPFDMRVLGGVLGNPRWEDALTEDRVIDTSIRFTLHRLSTGKDAVRTALDYAAQCMLGLTVEKNADIRLTFRQNMRLTDAHIKYAVLDAIVTAQLHACMPVKQPTESIHLLGFVALSDISFQGMEVDVEVMRQIRTDLQNSINEHLFDLSCFGYYPGEHGNSKALQHFLQYLEAKLQITMPRTATGMIQVNPGLMQLVEQTVGKQHPFLQAVAELKHDQKIISTYLKEDLIGPDGRMHSTFRPLVKTGRTSSSSPNVQNLPRKGGVRNMYRAPAGKVIMACDIVQAELCALADHCYRTFGKSVMRDVINSGEDLHKWFGEHIRVATGGTPDDGIDYRQMAKACNFGFPGGLGIPKFQLYAKTAYRVEMTLEQCALLKEVWLKAFPEMADHLRPEEDPDFSYDTAVETVDSTGEVIQSRKRTRMYIARTVNGRVRRNATYCSACNYPFQGLTADGAKMALWLLYINGYKVINFIHDEALVELPIDDRLQESVRHVQALMAEGVSSVIQTVTIRTEAALMYRWRKEAKPIHDENHNLLIWEDAKK